MMSENDCQHKHDVDYESDRQLPTETLCRIFCLLPPRELSSICAVSHRARAIAEPILYASPDVDSPARVLLLARTLLGRAELVCHIRSLTLNLDGSEGGDGLGVRYFSSLLQQVRVVLEMNEMENLRELVWCARGETGWALPSSFEHLPHITHFSTTTSTPTLVPFLSTHPSITHLTLHSHGLALRLPPYALPNLTHIACAAPALSGLPVRKLKHVVLMDAPFIPLLGGGVLSVLGGDRDRTNSDFSRGWRDASPSPSGEPTEGTEKPLRSITLRLGHVIVSAFQAPLILEPFVRHVPSLKRLGIVAGPSFFTREVLESLTSALEGFTELKSLQLECNAESEMSGYYGSLGDECDSPPLESEGSYPLGQYSPLSEGFSSAMEIPEGWHAATADETRTIIGAWKDACPSLDNVRLPWWVTGAGEG